MDNVAEATSVHGAPRYPADVVRLLERTLACWNYGRAVLCLCHLINAMEAASPRRGDYLGVLYGLDRVTPSALAQRFRAAHWRRSGLCFVEGTLEIRYRDGRFELAASQMPSLCALLELMLETVGFAAVDEVVQPMLDQATSQKAIGQAANTLSRALYAYLSEELPSQQQSQKFRALVAFLEDRAQDGEIDVDDAAILDFWCATSTAPGADFRSFTGVVDAFVAFIRASRAATSGAALRQPVSLDRRSEDDERPVDVAYEDPRLVQVGFATEAVEQPADAEASESALLMEGAPLDEWRSPLACLNAAPADQVKFLTKREQAELARVAAMGPLAGELPYSVLRSDVFGADQRQITQALRRHLQPAELAGLIDSAGRSTYRDWLHRYRACRRQVETSLKAAAHMALMSTRADNVVSLQTRRPVGRPPAESDQESWLAECRRAFGRINRQGFEDEITSDDARLEALQIGVGALLQLRDRLDEWLSCLTRLDAPPVGLDVTFDRDRDRFRAQFHRIYGPAA